MIAAWMIRVCAFSVLLGLAALAAERGLRTLGKPGRTPWLVAFALAVTWPALAPLMSPWFATTVTDPMPFAAPGDLPAVLALVTVVAPPPIPWVQWLDVSLLTVWVALSTLLLARLLLAWRGVVRLERSATREVVAGVPVLVTPASGPAVFGMCRARVFVPRWLNDLDASLRELVMRHETEHCRARDPQVRVVVSLATALVPWNVGAWWIARRLRLAIEMDCDTRVLRDTRDPRRYARLLLLIAQRQSGVRMATMLAGSRSDLRRRIEAMHAPASLRPGRHVALFSLGACAAVACSTRYGRDLSTFPAAGAERPAAGQAVALYYAPEGSSPAKLQPPLRPPRYPDSLRAAGTEGEVVTQFVVDSSGRVLPASIRVVRATHPLFAAAVLSALPSASFIAPAYQGRSVRQLVQQSWYFDIAGRDTRTTRPPTPVARPSPDPGIRAPMVLEAVTTTATR